MALVQTLNHTVAHYTKPQIEHIFKLKNISGKELHILKVSVTCGCTSTNYPTYIKPNEEFEIVAKVDKGENFKGLFAVDVKLEITDSNFKEWITLAITGEV